MKARDRPELLAVPVIGGFLLSPEVRPAISQATLLLGVFYLMLQCSVLGGYMSARLVGINLGGEGWPLGRVAWIPPRSDSTLQNLVVSLSRVGGAALALGAVYVAHLYSQVPASVVDMGVLLLGIEILFESLRMSLSILKEASSEKDGNQYREHPQEQN